MVFSSPAPRILCQIAFFVIINGSGKNEQLEEATIMANAKALELLKDEDIVIERAGKPVARLTAWHRRQDSEAGTGRLDIRSARGLGGEVWRKVDVAGYIAAERDSWD